MSNKILWGSLLVIIIISGFAYVYNKDKQKEIEFSRQEALEEVFQKSSITINTKHQYKDNQHTFVGSLELPTPCHNISTNVEKNENETVININYASEAEMCAQVITEKEFRVSFEGAVDENIIAKLNGEVVNLNIFEVDADKNIDEVEIFNKG